MDLLHEPHGLHHHILKTLGEMDHGTPFYPEGISQSSSSSAVLFLLGRYPSRAGDSSRTCVVFNKRSQKVRQPGDLCFPGGRIATRLDSTLARLLPLPLLPLQGWSYWSLWRAQRPREARRLALLLATSLRESLEEMRLNPLGVKFLGPLPSEELVMFGRILYPLVGWITRQKHFFPNWEVEKIIYVPLQDLLKPENYARYRLRFLGQDKGEGATQDFPAFVYRKDNEEEVLWGVTYRIVTIFLKIVFDFMPPPMESLSVVLGTRGEDYYNPT
ncbi:MAG: CoA pyrophosphatase [Deltaproteobacteria bacterium]|nr:CoA pyrophosphatase [Deltaproteobacteria bacterium]